jgi:hypothetical protein
MIDCFGISHSVTFVIQESERKLKVSNLEMDRMRNKLQEFVEKERESKARYSDILSTTSIASIVKGAHLSLRLLYMF